MEAQFSKGYLLCCEYTTNYDVIQCNKHFWACKKENIETNIWKKSYEFGINGIYDVNDSVNAIKLIKSKDQEGTTRGGAKCWVRIWSREMV